MFANVINLVKIVKGPATHLFNVTKAGFTAYKMAFSSRDLELQAQREQQMAGRETAQGNEEGAEQSLFYKIKDFAQSRAIGRSLLLASCALSLINALGIASIGLAVPLPAAIAILAGGALAVTLTLAADVYKYRKLQNLRQEDRLLRELESIESSLQKEISANKEIGKAIKGEMLQYHNFSQYNSKNFQESKLRSSSVGILTNSPEANMNLVLSILTLNPITYSIAAVNTMLTWVGFANSQREYDTQFNTVKNDIEGVRERLNLGYQSGKGIDTLEALVRIRKAELASLKSVVASVPYESEKTKAQGINNAVAQGFKLKKEEELKKDYTPSTGSKLMNGIKGYFHATGEVFVSNFSASKAKSMFSPLHEHKSFQYDNLPNAANYVAPTLKGEDLNKEANHVRDKRGVIERIIENRDGAAQGRHAQQVRKRQVEKSSSEHYIG